MLSLGNNLLTNSNEAENSRSCNFNTRCIFIKSCFFAIFTYLIFTYLIELFTYLYQTKNHSCKKKFKFIELFYKGHNVNDRFL